MKEIKELTLLAILSAIVFSLKQALAFLPNIQVVTFLFILYSRTIGTKRTLITILVYVFADSLFWGTFDPFWVMPALIAWSIIPITLNTVFKKANSVVFIMSFAFIFGFVYGWVYIPLTSYKFGIKFTTYLLADIPFEFLMGVSGAISVGILYSPSHYFFDEYCDIL